MTTAIKVRKKPVVVEASQWHKNGDHPLDACEFIKPSDGGESFLSEGKIVRYFRVPGSARETCNRCKAPMDDHGWIEPSVSKHAGGITVCPGDWIITGTQGEIYPCHPEIFKEIYELADDQPDASGMNPGEAYELGRRDAKIAQLQALAEQNGRLLNQADRLICESLGMLYPRVPHVEPYAKGGDSVETQRRKDAAG